MNHVLHHGHKRIGVVCDRLGETHVGIARPLATVHDVTEMYLRERLAGFRDAIAQAGDADVEVTLIEAADIDAASGMVAAGDLITHVGPTAIVTTSDVHAVAALKVLRAKGISVPDQVSVIGFDDAPIADLMGLTTIRQPLCEKGRAAATILLDLIAGRTRLRSVKPTELVVRSTTGPAPSIANWGPTPFHFGQ
jgi:DNA-binding LacI/PurR family transcriptional regulator